HSNKTTTKTNPAISRLSASPTPGNDPRHPNVARGVRETYIEADLRCTSTQCPHVGSIAHECRSPLIIPVDFRCTWMIVLVSTSSDDRTLRFFEDTLCAGDDDERELLRRELAQGIIP
ncbi:MAG: hypothetical protein ACI9U6_002507, partial [Loktanella salsilacus]|uniref:hypothetical protein n=1 Tax=Loktanella salsilacus TaxID=195913 RepID=UPI003989CD0F